MTKAASPVMIAGAGPAGLTAAYELQRLGRQAVVFEQSDHVGGIARTESYKGYRFDIGGHRFFTKIDEVNQLWQEVGGSEFISVPRLSRILYDGKFYNYPLSPTNVVGNLGIIESARMIASYAKRKVFPLPEEQTFEQWVINRFGERLYRAFFKTYTEKVWGIPCSQIRADWAAQRIKGLSLGSAIRNALQGSNDTDAKTLITEFQYPRLGPGQMWEMFRDRIAAQGGEVRMQHAVTQVRHDGSRVLEITVEHDGTRTPITIDQFITSMPITMLLRAMDPLPPAEVMTACHGLKYRDFLIVVLILRQKDLFPDNWIYIHSPTSRVGRIQNFRNWSAAMVPNPDRSSIGMEYFCSRGDDLWEQEDASLIELASAELEGLGLANASQVEDGCVIRQLMAYPVYDGEYRRHLDVIRSYLNQFENLQTIGRNGMHRYNNQDHSMLCGLYAARNVAGEKHDLWEVNTERSYYEEHEVDKTARNGKA